MTSTPAVGELPSSPTSQPIPAGTPLVSVIIGAYNPGAFLKVAVESVIAQTYPHWELFVVDDGSKEDLSWVDGFHPQVKKLRQNNYRVAAARNHGIAASSGELIAFLDADDVWLPHKLEKQVAQLQARPDAVLAQSQARFVDEHGQESSLGWGGGYETYEQLLDGCGVYPSCVLIRREVLFRCGLFNPVLDNTEDYDLWLKATRYGPMVADPEPLALYRLHGTNASRNYRQIHDGACVILETHLRLATAAGKPEIAAKCRRGLQRTHRSGAMQGIDAMFRSLKTRNLGEAIRHFFGALSLAPFATLSYIVERLLRFVKK